MPHAGQSHCSTMSPGVWLNRQAVSLVWMSPLGPGSSWQMAAWCLGVQESDLGDSLLPGGKVGGRNGEAQLHPRFKCGCSVRSLMKSGSSGPHSSSLPIRQLAPIAPSHSLRLAFSS